VEQAVRLMSEALRPLVTHNWSAVAGAPGWNCRERLTHIGHELLAYAAQPAGQAQDAYLPPDLAIRDDVAVSDVLIRRSAY
jgi:hypothetical protein